MKNWINPTNLQDTFALPMKHSTLNNNWWMYAQVALYFHFPYAKTPTLVYIFSESIFINECGLNSMNRLFRAFDVWTGILIAIISFGVISNTIINNVTIENESIISVCNNKQMRYIVVWTKFAHVGRCLSNLIAKLGECDTS